MVPETLIEGVRLFASWSVLALVAILGVLVLVGFANALYVGFLTLRDRATRLDGGAGPGSPLPTGFISMYAYLHLLADVLLVVVAIELIETLLVFVDHDTPKAYLTGVLGAALVALSRRIIVFFNPETENPHTGEMYAYAALVAALAAAFAVIQHFG